MAVGVMMAGVAGDSIDETAPEHVFDAATLGGAKALGRSDLGRLEPGAKADIAVFDMQDVLMAPRVDPVRTLILGATGRVTRAVFVDGRLSMRDGQVAGLDMNAARAHAQAQFDGLKAKYPDRTWGHPPLENIFRQPILRLKDLDWQAGHAETQPEQGAPVPWHLHPDRLRRMLGS